MLRLVIVDYSLSATQILLILGLSLSDPLLPVMKHVLSVQLKEVKEEVVLFLRRLLLRCP